jgi:hypothetical protein
MIILSLCATGVTLWNKGLSELESIPLVSFCSLSGRGKTRKNCDTNPVGGGGKNEK